MTRPHQAEAARPAAAPPVRTPRRSLAPAPFDVVLTALVGILLALAMAIGGPPADRWLLILTSIAVAVPLLWRTHAPVRVLAAVTVIAAIGTTVIDDVLIPNLEYLWIPVLIALGGVSARRPLWVSSLALVATYAALAVSLLVAWPGTDLAWSLTFPAVMCTVVWMLGVSAHAIRSRMDRLEAERQSSQAAVRAERREVASGIEVVIEQAVHQMRSEAQLARISIVADPDSTTAALSAVEADGIQAMQELRRLVRQLDGPTTGADVVSSEPRATDSRKASLRRLLAFSNGDLGVMLLSVVGTIVLSTFFGGGVTLAALVFTPILVVLLWRNRFPVVVFAVIAATYAIVVVLFHGGDFVWDNWLPVVGLLVALAAVAGGARVWLSLPLAVFTWAYLSLAALVYPPVLVENLTIYALFVTAVWLAGFFGGKRRRRIAQLESEREIAALTVRREHAELAHDLHDLIGHSITIMVLQAAGARRILAQDRSRAAAALDAIDAAGADALRELDQLVEVLRSTPELSGARTPAPPAGLAEIDAVVERTRSATRMVELEVRGDPSPLSSDVDATAFAVVREALANAEKHAGDETQISIVLSWQTDALSIHVTNTYDPDAPDAASNLSGGYGLTSLQERVHDVGGELTWAAGNGEFSVSSRFPW